MLAATRGLDEPLDHTLFGHRLIGEGAFLALQLVPAIAVQDAVRPNAAKRSELASTLHEDDRKQLAAKAKREKPQGPQRLRREAARLGEQFRRWIAARPDDASAAGPLGVSRRRSPLPHRHFRHVVRHDQLGLGRLDVSSRR